MAVSRSSTVVLSSPLKRISMSFATIEFPLHVGPHFTNDEIGLRSSYYDRVSPQNLYRSAHISLVLGQKALKFVSFAPGETKVSSTEG